METNFDEWELLPENSSFLEFGLDKIEDIISNEIIYTDYFKEEPKLIQQNPSPNQEDESQFKDISISHVFFKMINPKVDEGHIEIARISSEPKQSMEEFVIEEKVGLREEGELKEEEEEKEIWEGIGIGIWRWRFVGVGALFSIGAAAAATVCVVVLGGGREGRQSPGIRRREGNFVQFHFHDEDKRVSRVVEQASRLNQALTAARGTPTMMRAAKISFGGYYDSL